MASREFRDARLKIERAKKHINELNALIDTFLKSDFCRISVERNPAAGYSIVKCQFTKTLPEEVPLLIGDALHNMRTALDFVAFELVLRATGKRGEHIKFPLRETRQNLKGALEGGEMKAVGSDIINFILDTVQPYPGGNGAPLHALHTLDLTDKHLNLIPLVSLRGVLAKRVKLIGGGEIVNISFGVEGPRDELNIVKVPYDFTLDSQFEPMVFVSFREGDPFERQAVIPTLRQLAELVADTVQAIEKFYLAKGKQSSHGSPAAPDAPSE